MTFSRPLCAALLAAVAVLAFTQSTPAQSEGGGPARVVLSGEQLDESGFQLRAFVATGSLNPNCLVTMNESNFAVPGISVFCSPRTYNNEHGVVVSVFYLWPAQTDLHLEVTLYQEQAAGYALPVLYYGQ